jgi:hypothetical protein
VNIPGISEIVKFLKELDVNKMTENTERAMDFAEESLVINKQILNELKEINGGIKALQFKAGMAPS